MYLILLSRVGPVSHQRFNLEVSTLNKRENWTAVGTLKAFCQLPSAFCGYQDLI